MRGSPGGPHPGRDAEQAHQDGVFAGGADFAFEPLRVEGLDGLRWVLLDYGDFVVHVFHEEERDYYQLERLWADVPQVDWQEAPAETA